MSYNIGYHENNQDSLLISRADYDRLVRQRPAYMQSSYLLLTRSWSIAGVKCIGTESQIANLKEQLKIILDSNERKW